MTKSTTSKPKGKATWAEYRFKIDAYTPETMPMGRLAEYMAELSRMLGERERVHFLKLSRGSTVLVHRVEREAVPKVRDRVSNLRQGQGTVESLRAFQTINRLLREDNAIGTLRGTPSGGVVIRFPGREEIKEKFEAVRQHGSIDGIVTGIRGKDETIHITIQVEGNQVSGCNTTKLIAKKLGARLFEPVRLFGRGRWSRDADGNWSLEDFRVESFEALSDANLSSALEDLRRTPSEWVEHSLADLPMLRHGTENKRHGGH